MPRVTATCLLAGLLAGSFAVAPLARGHATYNLSGAGSGIGGSTNGADGTPADGTALWTNGPAEGYTGALPVMWYCGLHDPTQVRTIQTGLAPNPPSGSLLAQVTSYNAGTDPDYAVDRVLAVGGLSWSDPSNGDQGWGHGLDYGLIHLTPLDGTGVLAQGPVKLTVTLADDPTDGVAVRLAYALYAGWDTGTTGLRHQTFTTSPSPVDDPLGASGLTLLDYAIAPAPGATLSRTYDVDVSHQGKYTLFVGALGGVAGQYQLTAGVFPAGTALNAQLQECQANLSDAQTALAAKTADADADGVPDERDRCSQTQFCATFPVGTKRDKKICRQADWENDEPSMKPKQADCIVDKRAGVCAAAS